MTTRLTEAVSQEIRDELDGLTGRKRSAAVKRIAARLRISPITVNRHARMTGTKIGGFVLGETKTVERKRLVLADEIARWSSPVSKSDLLIMQSQIAGMAYETERNMIALRDLAHGIETVLKFVDDDAFAESLVAENERTRNLIAEHLYRINNLESQLDDRRMNRLSDRNPQTHSTE